MLFPGRFPSEVYAAAQPPPICARPNRVEYNIALAAQLGAREDQQLVDDLERVRGGEPGIQADEGALVGEPQAVIAPATRLGIVPGPPWSGPPGRRDCSREDGTGAAGSARGGVPENERLMALAWIPMQGKLANKMPICSKILYC